jgi:deoxyribonuclease-4
MSYLVFNSKALVVPPTSQNNQSVLKINHVGQMLDLEIGTFDPKHIIICYEYLVSNYGGAFGVGIREYTNWFLNFYNRIDNPTYTDKINKLIAEEMCRKDVGLGTAKLEQFEKEYVNNIVAIEPPGLNLLGSQSSGSRLGNHIKKETTYHKTLTNFVSSTVLTNPEFKISDYPLQIFTGSTKSWKKGKVNEKDVTKTKEYVSENKVSLFIHSIYLINLARTGEEFENARTNLIYDLTIGPKLGAKGVVVHVAKALKMGEDIAIDNMFNNIVEMLEHIDESCPLLVETPAGQGSEVLTRVETFSEFYNRFTDTQKRKVKICIDTCHVFASGYQPSEYINRWNGLNPGSVVLVHYNDSKCELGSKKDRHAPYGEGCIGEEELDRVSEICLTTGIPMVREY